MNIILYIYGPYVVLLLRGLHCQEEIPQKPSKLLQGRKMSDKETMSMCEEEGAVCR